MATKQELEEQAEALRRQLAEAGVKVLSGNWGGKGGIARYKGQWLVVIDRNLPIPYKLRLLQAMIKRVRMEEDDYGRAQTTPTD